MNDEFVLELLALLDKQRSKTQINTDIKNLEQIVRKLKLTATLTKGTTKSEINQIIKQLESQLRQVKIQAKMDNRQLNREINAALRNVSARDIQLNINSNSERLNAQVRRAVSQAREFVSRNPISVNIDLKKEKLMNQLATFTNKHTKINESSYWLGEAERLRGVIGSITNRDELRNATDQFQVFTTGVRATGYAAVSTTDKIKGMLGNVAKVGNYFGLAFVAVNKFRQSLSTLKTNDTILTEISKTSEMTAQQLRELGDEAFKVASKYGQVSGNYLTAVQEMARSGYEMTSKELGELSLLAQSAGDMTAEMANNYILATDAAYKYGGSVESLNAALDGANYISNRNSASLTDIADATRVSASFAANAGVAIDELTAAEATMVAATKRSGSEMGRAFRSIILNLQQVSGEFDGEVIDEEQLKKVEDRCHSLGVELEYMKDGVATLRNPIEVLKDLADVYNSLPDSSADKQGLISDIGGKYHANALSALLSRWDLYEKMVGEFSQGTGSALEEANKTADSWAGRVAQLQNTWDEFVASLTNKDAIKGGVSFLDNTIQAFTKLSDTLGALPVLLTAINGSMSAFNRNYGITQVFNKDTRKMDIQGNFMGIDFTAFKAQKKHFGEASAAMETWNNQLVAGTADINTFGSSVVQNNEHLKSYLATTSKDAPASLSGYKSYLNAAGVSTDALRLKTVLLNSAITMGLSLGIQAVVTTISSCAAAADRLQESAKEAGSQFSSTQSDIEGYKTKIEELYETINNSSSSYEETYNARKELLSIQDEMISKFGSEAEAVKQVTDAINGQTESLNTLTEQEWQEAKNSFISGSGKSWDKKFADSWANLWSGSANNFDRMKKEMENTEVTFFIDPQFSGYEGFREKLEGLFDAEKNKARILPRDFEDAIGVQKGESFTLSGSLDEIYDKLADIQSLAKNMGIDDKFLTDLSEQADFIKQTTDSIRDFYDQSVFYEKINNNEDYKKSFDEIEEAYKIYQNTFESGNEEAIAKAKQSYAEIVQNAVSGVEDQGVIDYFNSMYPELKEAVGKWEFEVQFKAALDDNDDNFANEVKNAADSFSTSEDILIFNAPNATEEQIKDYTELEMIAGRYNLTLGELVDKMVQMGLVTSQVKQGLLDKLIPSSHGMSGGSGSIFTNAVNNVNPGAAKEWVNSLSEEDAMAAGSSEFEKALERQKEKLDGAVLSADNYSAALEEVKIIQNGMGQVPSFTEAFNSLDTDIQQKLLDLAKSGEITAETLSSTEEYNTLLSQTGLSAESAKNQILDMLSVQEKLSGAADGLDKLKSSYEEFKDIGFVTAQSLESLPDAFKGLEGYDLFSEIAGDPTQGKETIQQAFNDIVKEYIFSQDTLSGLVNASEAQIQSYIANLKEMGVTNAEEVVNAAIQAMNQESKLLNAAEKEYMNYLDAKEGYDGEYLKSVTSKNSQLVSALGDAYKGDYDNWCDLLSKKAQAYNKFVQALKSASNTNSSGEPLSAKGQAEKIIRDTNNGTKNVYDPSAKKGAGYFQANPKAGDYTKAQVDSAREYLKTYEEAAKLKEQLNFDLSTIDTNYGFDYSPKGSGGSSGSGSDKDKNSKEETKKEFSEFFDWIERRTKKFQRSFDKWIKQAETAVTSGFVNKYYKKVSSSAKSQLSTYGKAYNRYMAEADSVGLDEKYAKKVRNGTIDLEEIRAYGTDEEIKNYEELADKIKKYQDYYDKAQDSMQSFMETAEKLYNLPLDKAAVKVDKFNDSIALLDKKLDNASSSTKKKDLIDQQTKEEKKTLNAYREAQSSSRKSLKSAGKQLKKDKYLDADDGITAKEKKKVKAAVKANKEVSLSFFTENSAGYKAAVKYNEALKANKQALYDAQSAQQDYNSWLAEAYEKIYNLPLDEAEKKIEKYSGSISLLDKKLANAVGSKNKNKLINEQKKQEKKTLNAYKDAEADSKKSLNSAKRALKKNKNLNADDGITKKEKKKIQDAVKNNREVSLSFFKENSAGYKAAVKYNEALKAHKKAADDAAAAQQDYNRYLVEAAKQKFDNIADDYNKEIQKLGWNMSKLDNTISEIEARGKKVNISYYNSKKNVNNKELAKYKAEKKALEDSLKNIKKGTDEWYDAKDAIQEVDNSISDCVKTTYDLNNAINQLHFDLFEDISDGIKRIMTEQEFLRGLSAHEKNVDTKTGDFTDAGIANLGSLSASYYASKENYARDKTMLSELKKVKKEGKRKDGSYKLGKWEFNSLDDLQAKIDEVYTKWQDDIKETYSLESSIADAMKEKYQAELDMLQELIDAKKEALNAEKDLHDYQRTLNEKTKDISTIQKQIAAYSGDTSQEGLAKLQKLQKELSDKEDDLRETEYDRYISDQQDMLDKLYGEYKELMSKKLDDFMGLVKKGLQTANDNTFTIKTYLGEIAKHYGYNPETNGLFNGLPGIKQNVGTKISGIDTKKTNSSGTKKPESNGKKTDNSGIKKPKIDVKNLDPSSITVFTNNIRKKAKGKKKETAVKGFNPSTTDMVKSYINGNAGKAKKKKKEYTDVNRKVYENKSKSYKGTGKILSTSGLKKLAAMLGVTYDGGSKDGNLYKKLKSIKFPGFRKGGIAKLIKDNGEDGITLARNGEGFIAPEHVKPIQELVESVPDINKQTEIMQENADNADKPVMINGVECIPVQIEDSLKNLIARSHPGMEIPNVDMEIPNVDIVNAIKNATPDFSSMVKFRIPDIQPVNNNMDSTTNINLGGITMYGVNDPKEFADQIVHSIKKYPKVKNAINLNSVGMLSSSNALSINSIR